VIDGKKFIVISVPEFRDIPIICKADANASDGRTILKRGGLYLRTEKASSELVSTSEDMRELMSRALLKRGDQLLQTIQILFKGIPPTQTADIRSAYIQDIEKALEFFTSVLPVDFLKAGRWDLEAYPHTYNEDRLSGISELRRLLSEAEVALRGWNFPHTDSQNVTNFASGRQSVTIWPEFGHTEAYRVHRNGLFIWHAEYWENAPMYGRGGRILSFANVIFQVTEYFLFFQRLYERIAPDDNVHIKIRMTDTKNRRLVSLGEGLLVGPYTCIKPELIIELDLSTAELRASASAIARKIIKRIFEAFNWDNAKEEMIEQHQNKLISRRF
jgi:hypothetical protein